MTETTRKINLYRFSPSNLMCIRDVFTGAKDIKDRLSNASDKCIQILVQLNARRTIKLSLAHDLMSFPYESGEVVISEENFKNICKALQWDPERFDVILETAINIFDLKENSSDPLDRLEDPKDSIFLSRRSAGNILGIRPRE